MFMVFLSVRGCDNILYDIMGGVPDSASNSAVPIRATVGEAVEIWGILIFMVIVWLTGLSYPTPGPGSFKPGSGHWCRHYVDKAVERQKYNFIFKIPIIHCF